MEVDNIQIYDIDVVGISKSWYHHILYHKSGYIDLFATYYCSNDDMLGQLRMRVLSLQQDEFDI